MQREIEKRDSSLDLVRILAVILVITLHFFLNSGFYEENAVGQKMYLMYIVRSVSMCCVPLFMVLSGYLMNRKTLSARYYRGLSRIVGIYVLACVFTVAMRIHWGEHFTLKSFLLNVLSYDAIPYSWYVEMHIGLFLMIPFLNVLYHGLPDRHSKQILIVTLAVLTVCPTFFNTFDLEYRESLAAMLTSTGSSKILPDFWRSCYPLTYYFLGCYLQEYRPRVHSGILTGALGLWVTFVGSILFAKCEGGEFPGWGPFDAGSVLNLPTTVLVFLLITNLNTRNWKPWLKQGICWLANLSFGVYLCSWVFDTMFYPVFLRHISYITQGIKYFLPLIAVIYLCSAAASAVLNLIWDLGSRTTARLFRKQ